MRIIKVRPTEQTPRQLAAARRKALKACEPFKGRMSVDWQACMIEPWGIVAGPQMPNDEDTLFIELDTFEEAVAFAAEVNGQSAADIHRQIKAESEYLMNLRRSSKNARK